MRRGIVVIGGGPAGMSAAITSAEMGAKVTVCEDKGVLGGQLIKQTHSFFGSQDHYAGTRGIDIARILTDKIDKLGIETWTDTVVTGIHDGNTVALTRGGKYCEIEADRIIVATGAFENMLPFPNSDMPGVYGAGGVQTLMNVEGVLPGKNVVMVGAGNIGIIVSYQLVQAGANVVCVVEAMDHVGGYEVHAAKLQRMQVPILTSHTVVRVDGNDCVESATIAKVENFKPIPGTGFSVDCDTVCIAVGLTPLTELLALAGCETHYVAQLGGIVAWHNEDMQTSLPHIYVAGDTSGIEEASTAMVEGRIAGAHAAMTLGSDKEAADNLLTDNKRQLGQLRGGPFGEKASSGKAELWGIPFERKKDFAPAEPPQSFEAGARAVVECYQNIPCNPCVTSCPSGAITMGEDINEIPELDPEKCTGCAKCVASCPGLAIFLVNRDYGDGKVEVGIPYELTPRPRKGDPVLALGRLGEVLCESEVTRVLAPKAFDRTAVVFIAVPQEHADSARFFVAPQKAAPPFARKNPRTGETDIVICRCEDVYLSEVEELFERGYHSFDELKRILRCGMGPCQGKTCQRLILGVLSRKLSKPVSEIKPQTTRSPVRPTNIGVFADSDAQWNPDDWPEKRGP